MIVPDKLEAGDIVLRRHKAADTAAFARFLTDPLSTRYMAFTDEQKSPQGASDMINWVINSYESDDPVMSLTIADSIDDSYLGSAGLGSAGAAENGNNRFEVYVTLLREARGNGRATKAMRALTDYLFDECDAKILQADLVEENEPSVAVFKRLGFQFDSEVERTAADGAVGHKAMAGIRYLLTKDNHRHSNRD